VVWLAVWFVWCVVHGVAVHGAVVVVVCRGVLCLVYCAVVYSLTSALEKENTRALQRVSSFRGFHEKSLRGFCLVFFPGLASLTCVVFCV
jgi:hypothetical protein